MGSLLAVPDHISNWQIFGTVWYRCKAAKTMCIKKHFRLLDDLLVFLVPGTELFYPCVKAVLDGIPTLLDVPASDMATQDQRSLHDGKFFPDAVYLFPVAFRSTASAK